MTTLRILTITTSLLVGCSPDGWSPAAESERQLIGGTPDTADPSVIALYGKVPGAEKGALCTTTVIAPTVLLTAAHCVAEEEVGEGAVFQAFIGSDFKDKGNKDLWLDVKEVHHDPEFSTSNLLNGHDIAVAILAKPTTLKPIPVNLDTPITSDMVDQNVRLVGYGLDDGFGQTGAGVKREMSTVINEVDDKLVHVGDPDHRVCNGDSGGPTFLKMGGKETIIGVNSFGIIFCLGSSLSFFFRNDKRATACR